MHARINQSVPLSKESVSGLASLNIITRDKGHYGKRLPLKGKIPTGTVAGEMAHQKNKSLFPLLEISTPFELWEMEVRAIKKTSDRWEEVEAAKLDCAARLGSAAA
eukprot:GHVU01001855.1.p1 GENE.GHVU01001855.1~~GHVU01001855.1.p1  ORF type:complete len:106 (-),score=5.71 GHVU01001855.1:1623-1940(-)